jgi:cytochrome c-type biogenesis protein CcmE
VTRKRQRMIFVLLGVLMLSAALALVLTAFNKNIVFFFSPTDLLASPQPPGRDFRLGGLVEQGSVVKDGTLVRFRITDKKNALAVVYRGVLPDLFREGQGVVVEGMLGSDGGFTASNVLAKHDEKYMPPEVAATLKKNGEWHPTTP